MIKLFAFSRCQPGLSMSAFNAHWKDVHGRQIADDPGLRSHVLRYELNSRLEDDVLSAPGVPSGWDGVATLHFNSLADFAAMQAEPAYGEHADDGQKFREDRQLAAFTEGPRTIVGPADQDLVEVTLVSAVQRNAALTREQFQMSWLEHERSRFVEPSTVDQLVHSYEQWHVLDVPGATCDGVAEHSFASLDHFREWCLAGAHPGADTSTEHLVDLSTVEFVVAGVPTVMVPD